MTKTRPNVYTLVLCSSHVIFIRWHISAAPLNETLLKMTEKEKKYNCTYVLQESLPSKSYTNYYFILIDKSVNMLLTNLDCHLLIASEEPLNWNREKSDDETDMVDRMFCDRIHLKKNITITVEIRSVLISNRLRTPIANDTHCLDTDL